MVSTIAEIFKQADKETKRRIREDARQMPEEIRPILHRIADRLFDANFNVNELKRESRLSSTTWPLFRQAVGTTPWDYISRWRIETGKILVETTGLQFWMIAGELGYDSEDVFAARFKTYLGVSPTEARRRAPGRAESQPSPRLEAHDENFEAWCALLAQRVDELESALGHEEVRKFVRKGFAARTAILFEALSKRSREAGRHDTQRGIGLADLALTSVEGSASALGDVGPGLYVRALARLGNARRLANDHVGAEREFRRAEQALAKVLPAQRASVKGEFLGHRGTLRLFQRRFDEARDDLHRAVALCRSTSQGRLEALARIQLASLSNYVGDSEAARDHLLSAQQRVDRHFGEDRHLRLLLTTQAACIHAESGYRSEALALIPEARQLATLLEHRKAEFQLDWIEAIARKAESETAERLLRRARQGFLALHDIDYTAIVSLDLALVYEAQGRSAEVVSLAAEALPALESLRLPEATAALTMLRRAIDSGSVTRAVLLAARKLLLRS